MAQRKKPSRKKKARGRPKGSTTRGPTVAVGLRISRELFDRIEAIRSGAEELTSRTIAMERLLREGLESRESAAAGRTGPKR